MNALSFVLVMITRPFVAFVTRTARWRVGAEIVDEAVVLVVRTPR